MSYDCFLSCFAFTVIVSTLSTLLPKATLERLAGTVLPAGNGLRNSTVTLSAKRSYGIIYDI